MSAADIKLNIFRQIDNLPEQALLKVSDIIQEYLAEQKSVAKRQREFGSMKGLVTYISPDFDEPLQDFKEYM